MIKFFLKAVLIFTHIITTSMKKFVMIITYFQI